MARRIRKARITHISLCPKGKNQLKVLYKADDGNIEIATISKATEDAGEILAVVYSPDSLDTEGDYATADVIRDMAHSFMRDGEGIDIKHSGVALKKEQAHIAESFIIQPGDSRFKNFDRDVTGGWATLIKVDDPDLRAKYRSGEWNGVSMAGPAIVEQIEDFSKKFSQKIKKELTDMELAELLKEMKASNTELVKSVVDALKPSAPKEKEVVITKEDAPPAFAGSPSDKKAVEAHAKKLKEFHLKKSVDWSDPASVDAYLAKMAESETPPPTDDDEGNTEDKPEVTKLKKELAETQAKIKKLKGASAQSTEETDFLAKEDQENWKHGLAVAEAVNKRRGFAPAGSK